MIAETIMNTEMRLRTDEESRDACAAKLATMPSHNISRASVYHPDSWTMRIIWKLGDHRKAFEEYKSMGLTVNDVRNTLGPRTGDNYCAWMLFGECEYFTRSVV
jgi:hypothetical protein